MLKLLDMRYFLYTNATIKGHAFNTPLLLQDPFSLAVHRIPWGTKEKPTMVPSMYNERLVGCICKSCDVVNVCMHSQRGWSQAFTRTCVHGEIRGLEVADSFLSKKSPLHYDYNFELVDGSSSSCPASLSNVSNRSQMPVILLLYKSP